MVSLDIAEKSHEERIFLFNELCVRFSSRPVRDYVRGATSRIMKFDAKDK